MGDPSYSPFRLAAERFLFVSPVSLRCHHQFISFHPKMNITLFQHL